MRRAAIFPLLGPALVLYLIADVAALRGQLDVTGLVIAALAALLSFAIVAGYARKPAHAFELTAHDSAVQGVAWLGLGCSVSLLWALTDETPRLTVEIALCLGWALSGALSLDLALRTPDTLFSTRARRLARATVLVLGVLSAALSSLSLGPVLSPFGTPWLLPVVYSHASLAFACVAIIVAFVLRIGRRYLGSGPEALAANAWAVLGLLPVTTLAVVLLVAQLATLDAPAMVVRLLAALGALALYVGQLWSIDPERRLTAGRATRELVSVSCTLIVLASAIALTRELIPRDPLSLGLWTAATLMLAVGVLRALRPIVTFVLAPARGVLLERLRYLEAAPYGMRSLQEVARTVLGAFRQASGAAMLPLPEPLLYSFDPAVEVRIDAAGETHSSDRALHPAIVARLRENPTEIIVREPLEAQIVRKPMLRPLIEALLALDALCVLPLVSDGELEGALVVPRGNRRSLLSLEELTALREHARRLSALLAVLGARARAETRAHELLVTRGRLTDQVEQLGDELAQMRADVEVLHDGRPGREQAPQLIAYSAPMRELKARLSSFATQDVNDVPVFVQAPAGTAIEPLARFLHVESGRTLEPFLVFDCTAVKAERATAALFGTSAQAGDSAASGLVAQAGCLRLARGGTLLLLDIAGLPLDSQRLLASTLASRSARAQAEGGVAAEPYAVNARVIASSRLSLEQLATGEQLDAELLARLSSLSCELAPLSERRDDIVSHALLAIDRACRRLGRPIMGFETEALAQLSLHTLPGNEAELEVIVERALRRARGERISVADLALDQAALHLPGVGALEGTLEEIERRALEHAMSRANGNKSEAARLLGLPRTTFLDKLRRNGLDGGARESSLPPN